MKRNIRKVIRFLGILALVLAGTVVVIPAGAHSGDVINCGLGRPKIDGVMKPGEWDTAGHIDFQVNIPGGGTTDGTVFAMNDGDNLYLAIRYDYVTVKYSVVFEFDNDNSGGAVAVGDDIILFTSGLGFFDNYRTTTGGPVDTTDGGTTDGAAASSNKKNYTVCEFSHPLDSADDSHDFSLQPGDTVGFNLFIRLIEGGSYVDTFFPESWGNGPNYYGDIVTVVPTGNGGQPNANADWGQAHKDYSQGAGPGAIGDVFSNDHQGWKGAEQPPYPGGIQDYVGY